MSKFKSYEDFLIETNISDKVSVIRDVVSDFYNWNLPFQEGLGMRFEAPIKIGTIDEHDLYVYGVHIGRYDIDNEVLFDIAWNKKDIDNNIVKWEYDTYFMSTFDAFDGKLAQSGLNTYVNSVLKVDENYLDLIISEVNKEENKSLSNKLNELYHLDNQHLKGIAGHKAHCEFQYYWKRYDGMADYTYYYNDWLKAKDMTQEDLDAYNKKMNDLMSDINFEDILKRISDKHK